jgi:hypothetical protein
MSIRAQSAAAVSRQNSSQGENSDETQSISSQNSFADENLISEDDQISPQDLLSQNFSSISPLIRQPIRSIFEDTDIMSIISVLVKAENISSLNESAD